MECWAHSKYRVLADQLHLTELIVYVVGSSLKNHNSVYRIGNGRWMTVRVFPQYCCLISFVGNKTEPSG